MHIVRVMGYAPVLAFLLGISLGLFRTLVQSFLDFCVVDLHLVWFFFVFWH
jgi:hypothetical protein